MSLPGKVFLVVACCGFNAPELTLVLCFCSNDIPLDFRFTAMIQPWLVNLQSRYGLNILQTSRQVSCQQREAWPDASAFLFPSQNNSEREETTPALECS